MSLYKMIDIKILALVAVFLIAQSNAIALDSSLTTNVTVTATSIFSMEFYTDASVIYSTAVPFSNVDPTKSLVYPNGRKEDDGKSDTGVVCISNMGVPWYLKMQGVYSEGLFAGNAKYYYTQPWDRNANQQTDGTLAGSVEWTPIPTESSNIYTSGSLDTVNTPFGTLSTFSFGVDPRGLSAERTYTVSVTYTMTTAP